MKTIRFSVTAAMALGACASTPDPAALDRMTHDVIHASFREQGIARIDRLEQDDVQKICSGSQPPGPAEARRIEAAQLATIQWPANGVYLDNWREGEKLAQNGRGMTWTDPAGAPSGGNCYNCHQLTKSEISFGTIGPSLYHYGKLRGITNPDDPSAAPTLQYTWGKIWNAKAYSACSTMPRFGHAGVLTQDQVRDLVALLLDPKSPVNAD